MSKLPRVNAKKLVRILEGFGFRSHRKMRGSHLVMKHPDGRRTTIPMHGNREIPIGTLHGILRDLKISRQEFESF